MSAIWYAKIDITRDNDSFELLYVDAMAVVVIVVVKKKHRRFSQSSVEQLCLVLFDQLCRLDDS